MCGAVNMLPGTAGVSWCSVTLRGEGVHMCGAVNMLPGTAGVSWCSVTLREENVHMCGAEPMHTCVCIHLLPSL